MGKRKNLQSSIDDEERDLIDEKMRGISFEDNGVENIKAYSNYLKTLSYKLNIKCKNEKQKEYLKLLKDPSKKIVLANGSPGTGKSYLSDSYALKALKEGDFQKVIICTPLIQSTTMPVGILPGSFQEKVFMHEMTEKRNFTKILQDSDNTSPEFITNALFYGGQINFEFVNYLRGVTLSNSLILVAEAENFSIDDILLILTRIGDKSKIVISGDELQVDRNDIKKNTKGSGLNYAIEKLKDMESVGVINFGPDDVVRNPLITEILKKWYAK